MSTAKKFYAVYIELMRFHRVRATSLSRPNGHVSCQIIGLVLFYIRFNNENQQGTMKVIQLCCSDARAISQREMPARYGTPPRDEDLIALTFNLL